MFGLRIYKARIYPCKPAPSIEEAIVAYRRNVEAGVIAHVTGEEVAPDPAPRPPLLWYLVQRRGGLERVLNSWPAEEECYSCGEPYPDPKAACPKSKRSCGHHCNCSWVHDHCHWCGQDFGETPVEDVPTPLGWQS